MLFEGLDSFAKLALIETLPKSLKKGSDLKDEAFYNSFGSFPDDQSPESIVQDVKASRKFKKKDIIFFDYAFLISIFAFLTVYKRFPFFNLSFRCLTFYNGADNGCLIKYSF